MVFFKNIEDLIKLDVVYSYIILIILCKMIFDNEIEIF